MAFFYSRNLADKIPYINFHTHKVGVCETISILNLAQIKKPEDEKRFFSIGIHPWKIKELNIAENLENLKQFVSHENVAAIGECGLDKFSEASLEEQEQIFIEQIKIAVKVNKPVIVHCVKAFDHLIRIVKKTKPGIPFIVHGYNNNIEIAQQLLENGFYLSFGKALLKSGSNAQKVFERVPFSRMFLETDDSEILIEDVYEKAAQIRMIETDKLKEIIFSNFKSIIKYE
ncbi:MAG: TatD-related deoxyribonuclease [Bacteroidetes bacterium]|jgi:TatD DNase family protein|nr:TatD-related deoxyribonuclease [Bacteroidota bacterium]